MADETWAMEYSDGSNNRILVWQDGPVVRYTYQPGTSSGRASGAPSTSGRLPDVLVVELWSRVQALAGHREWHTDFRTTDSGAFTVAIGEDEQHFRVGPCRALADFKAWIHGSLQLDQRRTP